MALQAFVQAVITDFPTVTIPLDIREQLAEIRFTETKISPVSLLYQQLSHKLKTLHSDSLKVSMIKVF